MQVIPRNRRNDKDVITTRLITGFWPVNSTDNLSTAVSNQTIAKKLMTWRLSLLIDKEHLEIGLGPTS